MTCITFKSSHLDEHTFMTHARVAQICFQGRVHLYEGIDPAKLRPMVLPGAMP